MSYFDKPIEEIKKNKDGNIIIKADGLFHKEYTVTEDYSGIKYGPELEFFVVDKETLKPRDCLDELAGLGGFGEVIKPELAAEQIEITSPPFERLKDLEDSLRDTASRVADKLDSAGACLLPLALFDTAQV